MPWKSVKSASPCARTWAEGIGPTVSSTVTEEERTNGCRWLTLPRRSRLQRYKTTAMRATGRVRRACEQYPFLKRTFFILKRKSHKMGECAAFAHLVAFSLQTSVVPAGDEAEEVRRLNQVWFSLFSLVYSPVGG